MLLHEVASTVAGIVAASHLVACAPQLATADRQRLRGPARHRARPAGPVAVPFRRRAGHRGRPRRGARADRALAPHPRAGASTGARPGPGCAVGRRSHRGRRHPPRQLRGAQRQRVRARRRRHAPLTWCGCESPTTAAGSRPSSPTSVLDWGTRGSSSTGHGIGLCVAGRLVSEMGGRLDVHSDGTTGTTVAVTLPRVDTPTPLGPARSSTGVAADMRVVVVEDHVLFAESLSLALRLEGHDVRRPAVRPGATTPDLVAAVLRSQPGVAILDLDLGADVNGADLIAPLTAAGIDVLVVTGARDTRGVGPVPARGSAGGHLEARAAGRDPGRGTSAGDGQTRDGPDSDAPTSSRAWRDEERLGDGRTPAARPPHAPRARGARRARRRASHPRHRRRPTWCRRRPCAPR